MLKNRIDRVSPSEGVDITVISGESHGTTVSLQKLIDRKSDANDRVL